ncbi:MAG: D-tyrosyl-tRNA(Tyr) deacylase [Candidatus Scalindua rubra]|uniref:D-aminoacyl-tRNA deacylase n=1 Tax=Candidatus Scalindua rubra TaxID=1872076 RepID=A0A1E3XBC4_9BACT|nr:MAG: D-tyrosyl-tRNA(Tyr) deacylase [Candidatus Scalindua rubra]
MRAVVQRVISASIKVDSKQINKIDKGIVAFVGIGREDTDKDADYVASKIMGLRIFEDNDGKMNLSLKDFNGQVLIVSQFTLFGDCRKGKRPSFESAAGIEKAKALYEYLIEKCKQSNLVIGKGIFREKMLIELVNDGPVTILLDSKKVF